MLARFLILHIALKKANIKLRFYNMSFDLITTGDCLEKGDLDALETYVFKSGKGFPTSYKEFVKKYGFGVTCNLFIIYIPMNAYRDSFFVRSKEVITTYQDVLDDEEELWFDLGPNVAYSKLKDLVPFSVSENGDYLFWDISTSNNNEYDIYSTNFRGVPFTKIASNLYELFDQMTSESTFKNILPFSEKPLPKVFNALNKV